MSTGNRPLSPFHIYRPQITSVLSITHRITGVALGVGALIVVYWLNAAAYGPDAFARAQYLIGSWVGIVLLIGWTFALFYHLANGIRHLAWDAGFGFDMSTVRASGWTVIVVAIALTVITWAIVFSRMGAAA